MKRPDLDAIEAGTRADILALVAYARALEADLAKIAEMAGSHTVSGGPQHPAGYAAIYELATARAHAEIVRVWHGEEGDE